MSRNCLFETKWRVVQVMRVAVHLGVALLQLEHDLPMTPVCLDLSGTVLPTRGSEELRLVREAARFLLCLALFYLSHITLPVMRAPRLRCGAKTASKTTLCRAWNGSSSLSAPVESWQNPPNSSPVVNFVRCMEKIGATSVSTGYEVYICITSCSIYCL